MGTILSGTADLPLHSGKAPPWLFGRMRELGGSIAELMVDELGCRETIRRISDPFWFQALSCILGFDWHSSGTTTVTMAALREGMAERRLPLYVVGGKGKASKSVEQQLMMIESGTVQNRVPELYRISRLSAKVDSSALQDGYDIYHHTMILDESGSWAVIQQGMNEANGYARRYHWLWEAGSSMVSSPHSAIVGERGREVVDFSAKEVEKLRNDIVDIAASRKADWYNGILLIRDAHQSVLDDYSGDETKRLRLDWSANWTLLRRNIERIIEAQPGNFSDLLLIRGVGRKTLLAMGMAANLVYGDEPSWSDPVRYSFAVGGKDGIPYPVDVRRMEQMSAIITQAVEGSRVGDGARKSALQSLAGYFRKGQQRVFAD